MVHFHVAGEFIECKCVDIEEVVGSHATSAIRCAYGGRLCVFKVAASLNKVKKGVVRVCCVNWRQGSRIVEVAKISTKRRWAWKEQLFLVLGVI